MTYPRLRLAVACCLFLGWIGFLAYLVARTRNPVILSRPQLLETNLIVVVEATEENSKPARDVTVKETLWSAAGVAPLAAGHRLGLPALVDCGPREGWAGPGTYIVPLTANDKAGKYDLAALPWSPGFFPLYQVDLVQLGQAPEKALASIAAKTGLAAADLKTANLKEPVVLRRNLPWAEANKLRDEIVASGADALVRAGEYRIYRDTDDAREQVRMIKGGT